MSEDEIKVEIIELDGKQYQRVKENGDEFWCIRTIAKHCDVSYENIRKHIRNKSQIFHALISKYNLKLEKSRGRSKLFLKVPEGIDQLRLYVRKLKNNPEMNKIMSFISEIRKGDIVAATKEDVEKLKTAIQPQTINALKPMLKDAIYEIYKRIFGELSFDSQRAQIIQDLIYKYSSWHDIPINIVWNDFAKTFNITGYRKAERKYFTPFLHYFCELDKKILAAIFNEYRTKRYQEQEIIDAFLEVLEKDERSTLSNLDEYT